MGLDTVELVLRVEEEFDLYIENEEAENIITVGDLTDCVAHKLTEANRMTMDHEALSAKIIWIVSQEVGVDENKIKPTSTFIDDLRMD